MANDIERRIEKLEGVLITRERVVVFDYIEGNIEAQREAYMAATPENEQAELFISLIDPTQRQDC
ncbi:hypothetical protein ELE36_09750 [Pseudolysobacter antarcticus]|uniref:Uncharacterized protein n=1 Tax=Pseudolysobacter antarcticus TaxID=2511995 RepID=A0A411HJR5_9GAMM|nr:hypothetical protein [Pseudolysobacter antarcticus]QBB70627.1 hypothetical protein ELE36_09750 [Pseudolysobacter antarcticus]